MKSYKDVEKGMCQEEFGVFKGCVEVSFSFLPSRLLANWGIIVGLRIHGERWELILADLLGMGVKKVMGRKW